MPPTVIIALVLLGLNVGANLLNVVSGEGNLLALGISIALLLGVLKGSEGTRTIVMVLCGIGIVFAIVALLMMGTSDLFLTATLVYGMVVNAVVIGCMNHPRTRTWMAHRSLGVSDE